MEKKKVILGKVGFTPKGEYSPAATYERIDLVTFKGNTYWSKKDGNTGNEPSTSDESEWWGVLVNAGKAYDAAERADNAADNANTVAHTVTENEKARTEAESKREEAEAKREAATAESVEKADNAVAKAEKAVADVENTESAVSANESERQANEMARKAGESERKNAETVRNTQEGVRESREASRVKAEEEREKKSNAFDDAEAERAKNEQTRVSNEAARTSAESSRADAESLRASAETERKSDYAALKSAMTTEFSSLKTDMQTAVANAQKATDDASTINASIKAEEEKRVTAETARAQAESNRASEEGIRQESETERTRQETARQTAESDRETTMAKVKADCEAATKAATDAASEATMAKVKADCEAATKAATDAASEATLATTKAEEAADGAEKVDASLDGNVLTVTNRKGEEKSVNLTDSDEHVSVTLTTSVSGVSVANTQLNVYLNNATIAHHYITDNNGQVDFTVPKGSGYRIVFPDKEGCSAIVPVQHIAAVGSRIIEVEYKAYVEDVEHVTVECIGHDDSGTKSGIEGKTVTVKIGDATSTYTTDSEGKATFDVAIGKSYTVSVTEIDGMYEYHSRVSVSRTAEDEHYLIHFSFYTYESGLWVITDDGKQYTDEEFEASGLDGSTIRLVKIASKNLSQGNGIFCIDLEGIRNTTFPSKQWCSSNVQFENIPLNGRDATATNYWKFVCNGLLATETLIAEGDSRSLETPAADWCYQQSVEVNGVKHQGYLPTCDQWVEAWNNREFVDWALETKYPGESIRFSAMTSAKWTSTQRSAADAWYFNSSPNNITKGGSTMAVPFYAC